MNPPLPPDPSRPKVLLFAYYYHPQVASGVQRAARLARYLPEHGFDTHVITSCHEGTLPHLPNVSFVPDARTAGVPRSLVDRLAVAIQRVSPYTEHYPWVPPARRAAERLLAGPSPIAGIISTSPPVGGHLAACWLKLRHPHLKWVADFRDPLAGNPGRNRAWAGGYDRALQSLIFHHADKIVAASDEFVRQWRTQHRGIDHKFEVVWNGFDPQERFGPQPLQHGPRRILLHAGVMYRMRHPVALITALDRLTANGRLDPSSFVMRFVGAFDARDEFLNIPGAARMSGLGCLEALGVTVPREQAMLQVATAHMLLLLDIVNSENRGYTVPAKLFDYVLTGRPILAVTENGSPVERILANCGVPSQCISSTDSAAQIEEKLLRFFSLPNEPVPPSDWFYAQFDGRKQAARFAAFFL